MSPRQTRGVKAERYYNASFENYIERVRKARALGCNLSYLGIDSQVSRMVFPARMNVINK